MILRRRTPAGRPARRWSWRSSEGASLIRAKISDEDLIDGRDARRGGRGHGPRSQPTARVGEQRESYPGGPAPGPGPDRRRHLSGLQPSSRARRGAGDSMTAGSGCRGCGAASSLEELLRLASRRGSSATATCPGSASDGPFPNFERGDRGPHPTATERSPGHRRTTTGRFLGPEASRRPPRIHFDVVVAAPASDMSGSGTEAEGGVRPGECQCRPRPHRG